MKGKITNYRVLWAVFLSLLGVLLPHTAWWFSQFETPYATSIFGLFSIQFGVLIAWLAAFTFESAIAVFTQKLAKHIDNTKNWQDKWKRFEKRYLNVYTLGLLAALVVSVTANYSHAVQFGQPVAAFSKWGIPIELYAVLSGAILPFCSLLFAWGLSSSEDVEQEVDPKVTEANAQAKEARKLFRESEQKAASAEQRAVDAERKLVEAESRVQVAEQKATEVERLKADLFSDDQRVRAKTISKLLPKISQRSLANITGLPLATVNEIVNSNGYHDEQEVTDV